MKVLVIGNGGREHAIAWKVSQSPLVERVYCAPGNGGTHREDKCVNINIWDNNSILEFAKTEKIDLTIVGPEVYLVDGIVDLFKENNLKIFGPSKKAAQLEGSKAFSKEFMKRYGVKTAEYETFEDLGAALRYIEKSSYPVVIKADGLAAGKGVVICASEYEAKSTLIDFMEADRLKGSGKRVVIEEYLEGVEASILSITDGETILPFISSKDHKKILEGEKGENTGGMGVVAPNPYYTEEVSRDFEENILKPTLRGFKEENLDYKGIVFFGVMITNKGVYNLEYNVRMGDPETQAVLPLMESDFVEVIEYALENRLKDYEIKWKSMSSCCVVAASGGYPREYETGFEINIQKDIASKVFIAGAKQSEEKLLTSGGRVLSVVSTGKNLEEAIETSYKELSKVSFEGMYYRKDIGRN